MKVEIDTIILEKIKDLVVKIWPAKREKLTTNTRLAQDLGMDGLDAFEFIEKYVEIFGVDMTEFEFNKHFGPEGLEISFHFYQLYCFLFARHKLKDLEPIPVTLGDLVIAAKNKKWPIEKFAPIYSRNNFDFKRKKISSK